MWLGVDVIAGNTINSSCIFGSSIFRIYYRFLMVPVFFCCIGSQANPVKNLSFKNIGFRDTTPTYMEPHGVPSGGDWALERRAAVFFEGGCAAVPVGTTCVCWVDCITCCYVAH